MIEFLTRLDANIFILINSHHSFFFDKFFLIVTQFGNGWIVVPIIAAVIIIATPRPRLTRALMYAAVVGILAGMANTQIKKVVNRSRPVSYFEKEVVGLGSPVPVSKAYALHVVGSCLRGNSFPSGHAATAFAAAAILALLYGGYFSLGFILALLVAYSRVYMGVHFPSDVFGGAALGSAVALVVIMFFRQKKYPPWPTLLRRRRAE